MNFHITKVDLKHQPNRREKIIFLAAVLIFSVGFVKSCWGPSVTAISAAKKELKEITAENRYLNEVVKAKSGSDEEAGFKSDIAKQVQYSEWAARIADETDPVLMRDFSGPFILRDVKIGDIEFSEENDGAVIKKKFKLSVSGQFSSVANYLVKIEALPLLLQIGEIEFKSVTENNAERVEMDLQGVVYGWK